MKGFLGRTARTGLRGFCILQGVGFRVKDLSRILDPHLLCLLLTQSCIMGGRPRVHSHKGSW